MRETHTRRPARHLIARGACPLAILAAVAACAGCSDPVRRYEVLSFFFDGVPLPPELAPPAPKAGDKAGAKKAGQPAQPKPELRSHAPYTIRDCEQCHKVRGAPIDTKRIAATCARCHDHELHDSRTPGHLKATGNALCLGCHDADDIRVRPVHRNARVTCIVCHDPHGSGQPYLVRPPSPCWTRMDVKPGERDRGRNHARGGGS